VCGKYRSQSCKQMAVPTVAKGMAVAGGGTAASKDSKQRRKGLSQHHQRQDNNHQKRTVLGLSKQPKEDSNHLI